MVYEDIGPAAATQGSTALEPGAARGTAGDDASLTARLGAADPAWLAELEHAAILGDLEAIDRLAGQIAFQDSKLADAIIRLSRRFEQDRIWQRSRVRGPCGDPVSATTTRLAIFSGKRTESRIKRQTGPFAGKKVQSST